VAERALGLAGTRGEADEVVKAVLRRLGRGKI
jgi:hypothetical protein